jgi:hypothetical protein
MQERRRKPRFQLIGEVTGKLKSTMDVKLIDVSEGGVQLESTLGLPPASVCQLKIFSEDEELILRAEVRRCRAQLTKKDGVRCVCYRSGLEFVEVSDRQLDGIRQLITLCADAEDLDIDSANAVFGKKGREAMYLV